MIRCFVVDDEKPAVDLLSHIIENTETPKCQLVGTAHSKAEALSKLNQTAVDLLFLDVRLGVDTGFDLLEELEKRNFKVIFTTAYNQYALKAFDHHAVGYILKPISPEKIQAALAEVEKSVNSFNLNPVMEAVRYFREMEFKKIAISTMDRTEFIPLDEIEYILSDGAYSDIYISGRSKLKSSKSLGHYESILPEDRFVRLHKRHIVNIDHIEWMDKGRNPTVVLRSGVHLAVSSGNKEEVQSRLERRFKF